MASRPLPEIISFRTYRVPALAGVCEQYTIRSSCRLEVNLDLHAIVVQQC